MKVLVIHFSQTGQLTEILKNITSEIESSEITLEHIRCETKSEYAFPWSTEQFYDAMPGSVLHTGCEIKSFSPKESKYDLVIFGYQPWYLNPSIPSMGILKTDALKKIINNTPVITVIGARNMWINAQDVVSKKIQDAGGKLVGNIPLVDKSPNVLSAVSIVHWMLSGQKSKKWGIFPKPGISQEDIDNSGDFGRIIKSSIENNTLPSLQNELLKTNKINIKWTIVFIESRAKKLFQIWAKLVIKNGTTPAKRRRWLVFYRIYLVFVLYILSPIIITLVYLFIKPFQKKKSFESILSV
jgi:hypothetical protein